MNSLLSNLFRFHFLLIYPIIIFLASLFFLFREHFILLTKVTGEYSGRKCLVLCNHDSENNKILSLDDYHCRSDDGVHHMVDDPNVPFCVVKLYEQIEIFMPQIYSEFNVGRILRRRANNKELNVTLLVNIHICFIIYVFY